MQVHNYFAFEYAPSSKCSWQSDLVEDITNYCHQLPITVPDTVLCRNQCTKNLDYQGYLTFLKYLAAETIILKAAGVNTQFKRLEYSTFTFRYDSRIDNTTAMSQYDIIRGHIGEIERLNGEQNFGNIFLFYSNEPHIPKLPYEKIVHKLYPLLSWGEHLHHITPYCCSVEMNTPHTDMVSWWSSCLYGYCAILATKTTEERQREFFREAMLELTMAPPNYLLKLGGVDYQAGLAEFTETRAARSGIHD